MKIKITPKVLKTFLDGVTGSRSEIIREGTLHIRENSISVTGMNPSHVLMVYAEAEVEVEDYVECDILVDFSSLKKLTRLFDKESVITVDVQVDRVLFKQQGAYDVSFTCIVGEPEKWPKQPGMPYTYSVQLNLNEVLSKFNKVEDHVGFTNVGCLMLQGANDDVKLKTGLVKTGELDSVYRVSYFLAMVKGSTEVVFSSGVDVPAMVDFSLNGVHFIKWLAPRIGDQKYGKIK
jgi:hypothetical protein